jgi:UDP-glucose 4-epimerase
MSENILVTGGAGCIGSDLVDALLDRGHEVIVIDNLSSGRIEHLERALQNERFRLVEGDLLDRSLLDSCMTGVATVFHLAANPDVKFVPGDPTDKDLTQNTLCTYNVLESMRRLGVRRFAFSSTSAVYGISERQPIPADNPMRPISLYGATKLSCEALASAFQNLFGFDCWIFRFANIVGPKVRKRGKTVIGDFVNALSRDSARLRILGNGLQAKSYLLSEECVEAMLFAVEHAAPGFNVFNLGCSDSLEVRRIAQMVVAAMGLRDVGFEYTGGEGGWPGDVPRFTLDVSAIHRLGWQARRTSEEAVSVAIRATIEAQKDQALCRP